MDYIPFGPNGPQVSRFGIGAMSFAGAYGDATLDDSHAVLDACRAAGVTHIDTSNIYGNGRSEEIIGAWFEANPGARSEMHLATKAGITSRPTGFLGRGRERFHDNTLDHLERELDGSLSRLKTECVDLFYVHRRNPDIPIEEVTGSLARLVAKGKARAIGFSEIAPSSLRRATDVHPIAAVQSEYSLSTRAPELGLVQTCGELGTVLVAFSPVGRTLLTDRPWSRDHIETIPFIRGNPRFMEPNYAANVAATDRFRTLAADMGLSAAGLAIAWTRAQGAHVLPIPGTSRPAHLAELLQGVARDLTAEDLAQIEAVLPVGWAHGDRYNDFQWVGPERYG